MYDRERSVAIAAVAEACRLTREVQPEIVATQAQVSKDDRSPVTAADLAAQVVVSRHLSSAFPSDRLLAEEDSTTLRTVPGLAETVIDLAGRAVPRLSAGDMLTLLDRGGHPGGRDSRYWLLDPIDGTRGFLRGDQYAVVLALVVDGAVVVGVLGCPNLAQTAGDGKGCLFSAVHGRGAYQHDLAGQGGAAIAVSRVEDPARATLCASVESGHSALERTERIAAALALEAPIRHLDSQCKYALVARGEVALYLRLPRRQGYREKSWDHAAGSLLVAEAGGRVSDLEGRALDLSTGAELAVAHGILASNRALHERTLAAARTELGLP